MPKFQKRVYDLGSFCEEANVRRKNREKLKKMTESIGKGNDLMFLVSGTLN